jgi:hypothetical protein
MIRMPHILLAWRPRSFFLVLIIALSVLFCAARLYLAGMICAMLALAFWLWLTRPVPNRYDDANPYSPDDPTEGF